MEVDERRFAQDETNGKFRLKLRGGRPIKGVERHPKTDRPLDPEPGLGGIFSLGLFERKARLFFYKFLSS
jgi:hypothetical protein